MPKFKPYQIVRVVRLPSQADSSVLGIGESHLPRIGDTGTVIEVYATPSEGYCVESVTTEGRTAWLQDFLPDELDAV